jgi:CRISPR-associated protein Csm4
MDLRLFRLDFSRVHFGDGSLEASGVSLAADTLFAALCQQALGVGGTAALDELVAAAKTGTLRLSDALPYFAGTYFVPKPVTRVPNAEANSSAKKQAKAIGYVPLEMLDGFTAGQADLQAIAAAQAQLGRHQTVDHVYKRNGADDPEPYRVGVFAFAGPAGLWLLATGSAQELDLVQSLLEGLVGVGLGGERTAGLGQFSLSTAEVPVLLGQRVVDAETFPRQMSLSVGLPADGELDAALSEAGIGGRLIRRSGFVASATYAESLLRKRDIYKYAAGAVFPRGFTGDVFDVQQAGGHPVYSYAKPVWLGLKGASNG